jgi:hypothetical protein
MRTLRAILMLLVAAAALPACDQNAVQQIAGPQEGGAAVKFFNFSVGSPAVNFYANDAKVTAIGTTLCWQLTDSNRQQCTTAGLEPNSGVAYGSAGNGVNAWYSDMRSGQNTLQAKIAVATDKDLAIASLPFNLAAGRFYSFYLSGIYNAATKTADSFALEDVLPAVDVTAAYVRFVNASANPNPLALVLTPTAAGEVINLAASIAYQGGSEFVRVPGGTYNLAARNAGTATNVITRNAVAFANGRVYTITARGNPAATATLALDNTANR